MNTATTEQIRHVEEQGHALLSVRQTASLIETESHGEAFLARLEVMRAENPALYEKFVEFFRGAQDARLTDSWLL